MSTVIRVENISKRYRLGVVSRKMLYEDLQSAWARWRGKADPNVRIGAKTHAQGAAGHIWAVKDVSLEIRDGDLVGIIGRNGSGKSTLLKILSQITAPTSGRALIKGKIASLLEVGTGFHPELTGRDNVFLNGVILGMKHDEVARKFDEIVDFSGVEQFIDTPVKRYSSGMRVRLAFAVAAHLDPQILIIDEVLAVGDAAFQQKCLGKIGEVARGGRTVLFVSHQAAAVENLCRRGIVLENGRMIFNGTQTEALRFYSNRTEQQEGALHDRSDRSGTGEIRITAIELRDTQGQRVQTVFCGQDVDVVLQFENRVPKPRRDLIVGIMVQTQFDAPVFQQNNNVTGNAFGETLPERGAFVCRLRRLPLQKGSYRLGFYITSQPRGGENLDRLPGALDLIVEAGDFFGSGHLPPANGGICLVDADWRLEDSAFTPPRSVEAAPSHA